MTQPHLYGKLTKSKSGYLSVGSTDHYKAYRKSELEHPPVKSSGLWGRIVKAIFIEVWHSIYEDNWIFKPPINFGEFFVEESRRKNTTYIDWKATKEKGELVRRSNLHTNGRKFYIVWSKILAKGRNITDYNYTAYRGNRKDMTGSRGLSAWIKKCSEDPKLPNFKGHMTNRW